MLFYKTAINLLKFTLAKLTIVDNRSTALQIGSPTTNIEAFIAYYNKQLKQYQNDRNEAHEKILRIKLEKFMTIFSEYDCKVIEENKKAKTVRVNLNRLLAHKLKLALQKKGILTSARESSLLFIDFLHIDIDAVQTSLQDVLKAEEEAAKSPINSENSVNDQTEIAQSAVTATAVTSENAPNETIETFTQENVEVTGETVLDLTKVKNDKPEKKNNNSQSLRSPSTKLSLFTIAKQPQLRIDWGHNFPVFDSHQNECTVYQLFGQLDCYFTYVSPVLLEKIDDQGLAILRKALNKHLNIIPVNSKNISGFMLHHQDMSVQTKRNAPEMIANKYGKLKDCKSDERYYAVEVAAVTVNNKRYHLLEINTYKPTHKKQGKLYHWPSEELQALHSKNQKAAKK